jgi:recombinational DNA repair protein RecT
MSAILIKIFRAEVLHDFDAKRSRSVMHLMAGKRLVAGGFYHLSYMVLCDVTICVT